jgi:ABC-2 type transport system ATP-binding protein
LTDSLAITVRGLVRTYGSERAGTLHRAVDGIDLDVVVGEVFSLLGPNGAGKTTTVEILEGLRRRDGGTVSVLGHDPAHSQQAWRSRIGIVLQDAGAIELLTVQEVTDHFATYYPNPRDPDEVIVAVGLDEKRRTRVRHLSGGQRRRLDVALGILGRPELLFLDEPTTGFDPEARRQFWDLIRQLNADSTTILLTTHYLDEAETLANRVAVIAGGRILEVNDPAKLGGRAEAKTRVSWTEDGQSRIVETGTPTDTVTSLAGRFGGEVPGLTVTRPSLEDIYLEMIEPYTSVEVDA